jgi:hypothetical protein
MLHTTDRSMRANCHMTKSRPRVFAGLILLLAITTGFVRAVPAQAEDAPRAAGSDVPTAAAVQAAVDLARTSERLETATRQLLNVQSRYSSAQSDLADTESQIQVYTRKIATLRARIKKRAIVAYTQAGRQTAALGVEHAQDLGAGAHYTSSANDIDQEQLDGYTKVATALDQERAKRQADRDELAASSQQLDKLHTDLAALRDSEQKLLDRFGGVPVMGDAWLKPEQIAAWFRSTGAHANLPSGTTIDDLAQIYIDEGAAEHVRGDLAFAQSIVETASFSVDAGNNYAGIGVCDSCTGPGYTFATSRDSVRTQIQLLRNYADPDSRASNLAHPPSPWLYGADPAKAAKLYDTFFLKGKAPLWNVMGNGNWATSTTYARSVIETFARMLAFASANPG